MPNKMKGNKFAASKDYIKKVLYKDHFDHAPSVVVKIIIRTNYLSLNFLRNINVVVQGKHFLTNLIHVFMSKQHKFCFSSKTLFN